ncbi:MAG: 3-methyladenine DNA glycosylase [Gemmataceae bacterium]|nr:3-methyladenine DNA glycosylase [Gemmata sp.]MDW8196063.1 3-methyladenine DNA glycosylase [Gemmataceae bacterium]
MPIAPEAIILSNSAQSISKIQRIFQKDWLLARQAYQARMAPWAEDRVRRMAHHQKHPVYDFLFEYYSFRPAHLLRWTPGFNVWLEGATHSDLGWKEFVPDDGGLLLPASTFPEHRVPYLQWAVQYLDAVLKREPSFSCLGLHEWAMVYRSEQVRHSSVPLRLSRKEIDAVVEAQVLRCTHYDAFRFFTPAAVPRNRWPLTRATTVDYDQPGCVHANMDLYRLAYKIAPFCPAELLADAFELAVAARQLDMRASPYDLRAYGFEPIPIETREGRECYIELQRGLATQAQPLRQRLLAVYVELLNTRIHH